MIKQTQNKTQKVTYDDMNPRIYFEEFRCCECGEWFPADEVDFLHQDQDGTVHYICENCKEVDN